jgi:hypothetical protein
MIFRINSLSFLEISFSEIRVNGFFFGGAGCFARRTPRHSISHGGRARDMSKEIVQRTYTASEESLFRIHRDLREHQA